MNREVIYNKIISQAICWICLLLAGGLLAACEQEEVCIPTFKNQYRAAFFSINEQGRASQGTFNFSRVRAVGRDTVLYASSSGGIAGLTLVFNPASDTATYIFEHRQGAEEYGRGSDTLQISYKRNFSMISPDCGLELSYSNIAILRHSFDSVQVLTTRQAEPAQDFDIAIYSEKECRVVENNRFGLGFFRMNGNGQAAPETVNYEEVSRRVGRVDSIFYTSTASGTSSLALTLNPDANSTTFFFKNGEAVDTLSLSYSRQPQLVSTYCTPITNYVDLTVTYSTFGHVQVALAALTEGREGERPELEVFLESPCEEQVPNPYRVGFFRLNEQGEAVTETLNFDAIRALGSDEVFYSRTEEGIQELELALNPAADSTTFIFENTDQNDTLTVAYSRVNVPAGPERYCPPAVEFTNISIKDDHTFGDVKSLRDELNENREGIDLEIYP